MAKATVTISDLTNNLVPQGEEVAVIIRSHPMLEEPVQIDAAVAEIKPVVQDTSEYVILEVIKDGNAKQAVVELTEFNALFRGDAYAVLQQAKPVKVNRVGSGKRSTSGELAEIRKWAAEHGIECAPKGRIAQTVVDQYKAAQAALSRLIRARPVIILR